MSLGVEIPRSTYTGNGGTTVFPYNFTLSNESDVQVFIDGEEIKTGFDLGESQVTFHDAPDSGVEINILRNTPFDQDAAFVDPSNTTLEELERTFDRITRHSQELRLKATDNAEGLVLAARERAEAVELASSNNREAQELAASNIREINGRVNEIDQRLIELASLRTQSINTTEGIIERATATFSLPLATTYNFPSSPGGQFTPEDIVDFRIIRRSGNFILQREDFEDQGALLFKAPIPSGNVFEIIIAYEKQS